MAAVSGMPTARKRAAQRYLYLPAFVKLKVKAAFLR